MSFSNTFRKRSLHLNRSHCKITPYSLWKDRSGIDKLVYNFGVKIKTEQTKFIQQEQATIGSMIGLFCHAKHDTTTTELCQECQDLLDYARERVAHCLFLTEKPVCAKCPVHCYKAPYKERIREVMRYSGPRLIFKDPIAVMRHLHLTLRHDSEPVARLRSKIKSNKSWRSKVRPCNGLLAEFEVHGNS